MKKLFLSLFLLLAINFSTSAFSIDVQEDTDVGIEQVTNDIENVVLSISVDTENLDQNTLETDFVYSNVNTVSKQNLIVSIMSKKMTNKFIKNKSHNTYNKYLRNLKNDLNKANLIIGGNTLFYSLRSA